MNVSDRVTQLEDAVAIATAKTAFVRQIDVAINAGERLNAVPPSASESLVIEVGAPINVTWTYQDGIAAMRLASFSLCFLGSEQIDLDEQNPDRAVGQWVSWHPITFQDTAWLVAGRFRDDFIRTDGVWRLSKVVFTPEICTRWEEGWGNARPAARMSC